MPEQVLELGLDGGQPDQALRLRACRAGPAQPSARHPLQNAHRELAADHGRDPQAALGLLGQLVDAREQQAVQRVRDLDAGDRVGGHPAVALADDRAALDEHPDDLLDEERIALRALEDLAADLIGERLDLEQVRDQGARLFVVERLQADLGDRRAVATAGSARRAASRACPSRRARPKNRTRMRRDQRDHAQRHLDRRRIRPVDVLAARATSGPLGSQRADQTL